jgi:hypothetical protein
MTLGYSRRLMTVKWMKMILKTATRQKNTSLNLINR